MRKSKSDNAVLIGLLLGVILVVPFINIWALNTLFGLGIAYTFWTWVASLVLTSMLSGGGLVKKNS